MPYFSILPKPKLIIIYVKKKNIDSCFQSHQYFHEMRKITKILNMHNFIKLLNIVLCILWFYIVDFSLS